MKTPVKALCLLLLILLPSSLIGAEQTGLSASVEEPITVSSDRLEADNELGQVRFIGHVVARQGDLKLFADELLILYAGESRTVRQVVVTGNARIIQGDRVATGDKGVYLVQEERIVLSGSPRLQQGENSVTGDEIIILLSEQRSIVKGQDDGRVEAIFQPEGDLR